MFKQLHRARAAIPSRVGRTGPLAVIAVLALLVVPTASSGNYGDPSGDSTGGAGDVTAVTVTGDKGTGQLLFRITGSNIASSEQNVLFLDIDSDANPSTGNLDDDGADYSFFVDDNSYGFAHWSGSDWVEATGATVRVTGDTGHTQIAISVNRSDLGNATDVNFSVTSLNLVINPGGAT